MREVVIDADPGTDDAIGILVALGSPGLRLRGVTTVGGNVSVDAATDNTLRLLTVVESQVPVFPGCASPIGSGESFGTGSLARPPRPGRDRPGFGLPMTGRRAERKSAVDFLVETFTGPDVAETELVATGPLTNVATALLRAPAIARSLRRLVVMGGSRNRGNVTRSADFNFWADPEAARLVLRSEIPEIVLFPLDATRSAPLTDDDCTMIESTGKAGELAADIIRSRMSPAATKPRTATVHDALCLAHLVAPVVQASERCQVDVDTSDGDRRGATDITLVDHWSSSGIEVVRQAQPDVLARTIAKATSRLSART